MPTNAKATPGVEATGDATSDPSPSTRSTLPGAVCASSADVSTSVGGVLAEKAAMADRSQAWQNRKKGGKGGAYHPSNTVHDIAPGATPNSNQGGFLTGKVAIAERSMAWQQRKKEHAEEEKAAEPNESLSSTVSPPSAADQPSSGGVASENSEIMDRSKGLQQWRKMKHPEIPDEEEDMAGEEASDSTTNRESSIQVPVAAEISPDIVAENEELRRQLEEQRKGDHDRPILVESVAVVEDKESFRGIRITRRKTIFLGLLAIVFLLIVGVVLGLSLSRNKPPPTPLPTQAPTGPKRLRNTEAPSFPPSAHPSVQPSENTFKDCPCFSEPWPEFTAAIEAYSTGDSCYKRKDPDNSNILAIESCERGLTAYMSYDFHDNTEARYCGDSSSNRKILTAMEGLSCENLLQSLADGKGNVCNDDFGCVSSSTTSASSSCPCYAEDEWPEFFLAVEAYRTGDSCYTRADPDYSNILAIGTCERGLTAYMSYDFGQGESRYCGDSSSNRKFLTAMEGLACEDLLKAQVDRTGNICDDNFGCG